MNDSVVTRTLTKVLHAVQGEDAPLVIPYGSNCNALWALNNPWLKEQLADAATNGMILIWDGPLSSTAYAGRDTTEYLNPLTWGLCALWQHPDLRLAILDCDSSRHDKGRFYQVIQALDPRQLPFRLLTNPSCCVADCLTFLQDRRGGRGASKTVMDLLIHQMRTILTERSQESNRHALANIIGPLVLLGDNENVVTRGPQQALVTLFKNVGLVSQRHLCQAGDIAACVQSPAQSASAMRAPQGQALRTILIDDQWEEGWDRWISKMLTERPDCRLEKTTSPEILVHSIEAALARIPDAPDLRFSMTFPNVGGAAQSGPAGIPCTPAEDTVLLLDLRLFSLTPVATEAEFVFDRLLPLCRRFLAREAKTIPGMLGFRENEIKTVETWCVTPTRETDDHLLVLSLLPRLLALADFSLPIVLFSSTGQRRIMELLKPYGNIITDFEKPRFTGLETTDLVARAEEGFANAMMKAGRLLAARRHCRSIIVSPAAVSCIAPLPKREKTRYVELFIDEGDWTHRGATHFSVGGCFAVFDAPSLREARAKADSFDDALIRRGIRYFESRNVGVEPPDRKLLRKGENIAPRLDNWRTEESAPVCLGALRMRIEKGKPGSRTGSLANPESADNRYFLSLKSLLELFLCETVPALAGDGDPAEVIVSVFPATRAVAVDADRQNTAMTNYGLKSTGRRGLFFSLDRSFVYPLVDDILDSHGIKRRTARLLAPQLPYSGEYIDLPQFFVCTRCNTTVEMKGSVSTEELHRDLRCSCTESSFRPDYRALHYLADEMLSQFPDGQRHRPYDELFSDLIQGEFDELWGAELANTLTAGRLLDAGDLVGAVATFRKPAETKVKPRAGLWLGQRLAERLSGMTGEQFVRLSGVMKD